MSLVEKCLCGLSVHSKFTFSKIHGLSILKCPDCGVMHQKVVLSNTQYEEYEVNIHDDERYDHDKEVAELRMGKHDHWFKGTRLLDIGAGNGAFVNVAREYGLDAWGLERNLNLCNGYVLPGTLIEQRYEAQEFDNITIHDVLERLIDPVAELKEIHRILSVQGVLIIEVPDYFDPSGIHHWRPTEHLWLFDREQIRMIVEHQGFSIIKVDKPIPSKIVMYAEKRT